MLALDVGPLVPTNDAAVVVPVIANGAESPPKYVVVAVAPGITDGVLITRDV